MFFQLGVLVLGSTVSLTSDEVDKILESFPPPPLTLDIITFHNIRVSMYGFLPLYGVWWMGFVGFNTGIALKAIAMSRPESTTLLFFTIASLPHYWLEEFACSIALTAGLMFLLALLTLELSTIFHEVKILLVSLVAWAMLLVFAGFMEVIPMSFAFISWVVLIPLFASVLEIISGDSLGYSRKAISLVILFLYFSFLSISLPIAMYVLLGYYLLETLTKGWLRHQIQKISLTKRKHFT